MNIPITSKQIKLPSSFYVYLEQVVQFLTGVKILGLIAEYSATVLQFNHRTFKGTVNFLFQLIFIFSLFLGMATYANEFNKTKEKQIKK